MLVEPLADVDVNVPGVMATFVAPAAAQLTVLLVPEFTLVGFAVKDVIVGTEAFSVDELDEPPDAHPARPTQAINKIRTTVRRCSPEEMRRGEWSLLIQKDLGESMGSPFLAVVHPSLVIFDLPCLLVASTESASWSTRGKGKNLSWGRAFV
jgi:hypothetical protein